MKSAEWICKKNEIACHIRKLFEHYDEDESIFDTYLADVLKHDIDEALMCFRDLIKQLEWMPRIGNEQRLQRVSNPIKTTQAKKSQFQSTYRRRT